MKNLFIHISRSTGKNILIYKFEGHTFKYVFKDIPTLRKLSGCISNGRVSHEDVPIELLRIDHRYDAIIDIGAHFGIYSVILGVLNKEIPLYCFEPNDNNRRVLEWNVAANNLGDNVFVREEVVNSYTGDITFYENPAGKYNVSHTADPSMKQSDFISSRKKAIDIDQFCYQEKITNPWVKIDAEGAEWEIITQLISSNHINITGGLFELHVKANDINVEKFRTYLNNNGYIMKQIKWSPISNPGYIFYPIHNK